VVIDPTAGSLLTAVNAKRKYRRLERHWYWTRRDEDRMAYRSACREANVEINKLLQSFYQKRLTEAAGSQGAQWKIVRELLHSDDDLAVHQATVYSVQSFFTGKLQCIASEIRIRLPTAVQAVHRVPTPVTE
jgi:hypothetical protein